VGAAEDRWQGGEAAVGGGAGRCGGSRGRQMMRKEDVEEETEK
jgi:hypothetical protein